MIHFLLYYVMRWLALRLDMLAVTVITATSLFIVLMKDQVDNAYAGLALAYAAQVSLKITYTLITQYVAVQILPAI